MKERVESLETQLALIKADLATLKNRELELPEWVRTTAVAILFAVFAQTITAVWWASNISTKQEVLESRVDVNTDFRLGWHDKHREVMSSLQRVEIKLENIEKDNRAIKAEHKTVRDSLIREGI
jgi:ABC-type proline/glycine betaine transport system substrate-binding protein